MVRQKRGRYKLFPGSKSHRARMDAIVADLFARGGPMLPGDGGARIIHSGAPKECPALLAEQQRLIKTWSQDDDK